MRKVVHRAGLLAASCVASTAHAGFLGWAADSYSVNVSGVDYAVIDVYAMCENQGWNGAAISGGDKLLNVWSSNITLINATNFYQQNDTWAPLGGTNAADSKCTTGGQFGNCAGDPSFTNWDDSDGGDPTLPPSPDAGWAVVNPNPANGNNYARTFSTQGTFTNNTGSNFGVFIGRFTLVGISDGQRQLHFKSNISTGLVDVSAVFFSSDDEVFSYVPAPGAMALLCLAGLTGRRRRE